jgi:hypothetical protein
MVRYKPLANLDYHHIQPLSIIRPVQQSGDLHYRVTRERRKTRHVWKPQRPIRRMRVDIVITIGPAPAPEPTTVYTPYGPVTIDSTPRSPTEEILHLAPLVAIACAFQRPRTGGGLRHTIWCWLNNLVGNAR